MDLEEVQISGYVSRSTKALLERYVRRTGVKKGRVLEDALRQHLEALEQLPADVIVKTHIVVSRSSGEEILRRMKNPRPTAALRKLMRKRRRRGNPGAS